MEQYWDVILIITEIVNIVISGLLIGYYVKPYLRDRKNRKTLAVAISYIAVMIILYFVPFYLDSAFAYVL